MLEYNCIFGLLPLVFDTNAHRFRKPKRDGWEPGHCKGRTTTVCDARARQKRVMKRRLAKGYGV